jgi:hypothetical protein
MEKVQFTAATQESHKKIDIQDLKYNFYECMSLSHYNKDENSQVENQNLGTVYSHTYSTSLLESLTGGLKLKPYQSKCLVSTYLPSIIDIYYENWLTCGGQHVSPSSICMLENR